LEVLILFYFFGVFLARYSINAMDLIRLLWGLLGSEDVWDIEMGM
jgi:hypothetical protein